MPVVLRHRGDLSVHDIERLAREQLVRVTPHVGNWTPARLALPQLGVSVLCVDHTIGERDVNAHPHLLIRDGSAALLSGHGDRLTTHAYVSRDVPGASFAQGTSVSEVHIGAIRALYPGTEIVTHVEHMREHQELLLTVLEIVTALSRTAAWWRRVDRHGMVTAYRGKDIPRTWDAILPDIFPIMSPEEGWLVHNRVSILFDLIQQSRMGQEPEIYHLSGPDMVRYLGQEIETVSRMYDTVRARLNLKQETVTYNLVPFASFRFATRASQALACERLCEALVRNEPMLLRECVREASDVLAQSETKSYFTQHDCHAQGERIVICDAARAWSMDTCATYLERMRAAA